MSHSASESQIPQQNTNPNNLVGTLGLSIRESNADSVSHKLRSDMRPISESNQNSAILRSPPNLNKMENVQVFMRIRPPF